MNTETQKMKFAVLVQKIEALVSEYGETEVQQALNTAKAFAAGPAHTVDPSHPDEVAKTQKVVGFLVKNPHASDLDIVDFADNLGIEYPVDVKELRATAEELARSDDRKAPKKG